MNFTGDEWDGETSLSHTLFRQYHPFSGRWTTPDPAGMAAADPTNPQSWNRYAYVLNNPLSNLDPLGLQVTCDFIFTRKTTTSNIFGTQQSTVTQGYSLAGCSAICPVSDGWGIVGGMLACGPWAQVASAIAAFGNSSTSGSTNSSPWESRNDVLALLDSNTPCAQWFKTGTGSAHDIMSTTPIDLGNASTGPLSPVDADTAPGPRGAITVYPDGRFYPNSKNGIPIGANCDLVTGNCTGGYGPGSYGARMIILLHELAHKVNLIRPDGLDQVQSVKNTQIVMAHCASAIGAQLH